MGSEQWTAGITVQEMLLQSLRSLPKPQPSLFLTAWKEIPPKDTEPFLPLVDDLIYLPAESDGNKRTQLLREYGVDVFISLPTESALTLHLPRIVWVYDFQHLHYPGNFPLPERERRNRLFRAHTQSANRILVYSLAVLNDLIAFAPQAASRARLVRFVPHIPDTAYETNPAAVASTYNLRNKYFLMPNQFLRHKNHAAVVDALSILPATGARPLIVCTGRHKTPLFNDLMSMCRQHGIQNHFVALGLVPRGDYYPLMRQSICVLNPSLFEGFGLSVVEAKHLGKRAAVSDLSVFHEHDMPAISYFDPQNPNDAAGTLLDIWNTVPPGPDLKLEAAARVNYPRARLDMAHALLDMAREAIHDFNASNHSK